MELKEQVYSFIEKEQLIGTDDRILVALSGGADSVCLLLVLESYLREKGKDPGKALRAFHLHHGLRGEEADRDAEFSKNLCDGLGITLVLKKEDAAAYARDHGLSEEEAGRYLRYSSMEAIAGMWENETGAKTLIALAHHADDNAETVLHHLLRGSGLKGLAGIRPKNGRRIRPLLQLHKREICEWLKAKGQTWCEDSTNSETLYMRNRLRLEILPLLSREINPKAGENIVRAAGFIGMADDFLEREAGKALLKNKVVLNGSTGIRAQAANEEDPLLASYVFRLLIEAAKPHQKDVTAAHYDALRALALKKDGASCDLPGGLRGRKLRGAVFIENKSRAAKEASDTALPGEISFFPYSEDLTIPTETYRKWFDSEKFSGHPVFRTRKSGDYILLPGGGKKTIARYMIDEKIPADQRDSIWLLEDTGHPGHIAWIVGWRISDYYKIDRDTKTVMEVSYVGKNQGAHIQGGCGAENM